MACCLCSTKPLSEPMLSIFFWKKEHISIKFYLKLENAFQTVVCKMGDIFSWPKFVKPQSSERSQEIQFVISENEFETFNAWWTYEEIIECSQRCAYYSGPETWADTSRTKCVFHICMGPGLEGFGLLDCYRVLTCDRTVSRVWDMASNCLALLFCDWLV